MRYLLALLTMLVAGMAVAQTSQASHQPSPLHWAAEHGITSTVSKLIDTGADPTATDAFLRTPLHLAVAFDDVVVLLLSAGAQVDAQDAFGRTPLHLALQYPDSLEVLLTAGARVDLVDFMGYTPLQRALRYGTSYRNLQVVDLLIEAGS